MMDHSDNLDEYGDPADLEDADIIVERPVGAVVSVRFNDDELAVLREALDDFGIQMTSTFIKSAVFEAISARRRRAPLASALRNAVAGAEDSGSAAKRRRSRTRTTDSKRRARPRGEARARPASRLLIGR